MTRPVGRTTRSCARCGERPMAQRRRLTDLGRPGRTARPRQMPDRPPSCATTTRLTWAGCLRVSTPRCSPPSAGAELRLPSVNVTGRAMALPVDPSLRTPVHLTQRSTAAISAGVVHGHPKVWEGHGMAKEMEGDNRKRRALAKAAREHGHRASEAGVSLGSSKQRHHAEHPERTEQDEPPPEGANNPGPRAPRPQEPPEPDPTWPRRPPPTGDTAPDTGALRLRYRELVTSAAEQVGVDFDTAREAGRATISVLARMLDEADRRRLLDAVPAELTDGQDLSRGFKLCQTVSASMVALAHGTNCGANVEFAP